MFKRDQTRCAQIAQGSEEGLFWVLMLAITSARQPFWQMERILQEVKAEGVTARWLFGHKRAGHEYLREPGRLAELQRTFSVSHSQLEGQIDQMLRLLEIPGLGLVKAGFALQLLTGQGGCIDGHNYKRFGVAIPLRWDCKWTEATQRAKVCTYLELCEKVGGSESLWNSWCRFIAALHEKRFKNAWDVSAWHWRALPLEEVA